MGSCGALVEHGARMRRKAKVSKRTPRLRIEAIGGFDQAEDAGRLQVLQIDAPWQLERNRPRMWRTSGRFARINSSRLLAALAR